MELKKLPIHFGIDPENQIVLTTFSRATKVNDFVEHAAKLAADSDFHPGFGELVEFIDEASIDLSYADLKSALGHDPFSTVSKRAVVVYSQAALLASIRMYQILWLQQSGTLGNQLHFRNDPRIEGSS